MRPRTRRKRSDRRGTAAVEFACVAPTFFLVVLAFFEFGRAYMVIDLLGDAARSGCREGAVQGKSSATLTSDLQTKLQGEGISGTTVSVQVNGATGDPANANSGDAITVSVSVPASSVLWTPASFVSGNISGQSTLDKE